MVYSFGPKKASNGSSALLRSKSSEYKERYGIANYTVEGLARMAEDIDFDGRRVLEFGGWNIPTEITIGDLGASTWTSIDMIGSISGAYQAQRFGHLKDVEILDYDAGAQKIGRQPLTIINGDATLLPPAFFGHFDIVVSFATIEHVLDIVRFLEKAWRALVPGGVFATRFGPIWPSVIGHHAYVSKDLNFQKPDGPIGPWGHLLLRPPEMLDRLLVSGVTETDAALTIQQLYTSPRINRYFTEDYQGFFDASKFKSTEFKAAWSKPPPPDIEAALRLAYPMHKDFSTGAWHTLSYKV